MALVKESIQRIIDIENNEIISNRKNGLNDLKNASSKLKANSNYQAFVEGTEIGKTLDDSLNQLFTIIENMDANEIENLIKIVNAFVETQSQLNSSN